ncbi:hypothetical protein [Dehalobacterium formicoaceticum]|uniref:Uncharacterized protein n=1 Tax=Dehalobacterium formicoaceticum TaxID=51515 RepID=A0ABT1Y2Y8_9FIRM|nr:hypothetical protein [Dehalobacterium formicoaceticum]MCR6544525.1 hypothetical protein [Dehalobacterium formicoaceticum]
MSTLHEIVNNKHYLNRTKPVREKSKHEAAGIFNALTMKEKCLYLVKISKKNTRFQALGLMGLTLLIITVDYLLI